MTFDRDPVLVDLALQGGGAHGAFTWGVLDRLLQEPWLQIDGISGTSAGAMNAAVLVDGYAAGGPEGARAALEGFWRSVSDAAKFSPFRRGPLETLLGQWTLDYSPFYLAMDMLARLVSPYDAQSGRRQSTQPDPCGAHRFRAFGECADQTVRHRHERAHRPGPRVPQQGRYARRVARLRLPADHVSGDRNRWRELLGRRLCRQSDHHAARARMSLARHHPRSDQSDRAREHPAHRARYPQSPERSLLQRRAPEGIADDCAVAPGRQRRRVARERSGRACAFTGSRAKTWRSSELRPS